MAKLHYDPPCMKIFKKNNLNNCKRWYKCGTIRMA